jgi:hypothetical protein
LVVSPKGSDIRLRCSINYAPQEESSSHVFWSRDNKLLNFDESGRWFVWTERLVNDPLLGVSPSSSASSSSATSKRVSSSSSSVSDPILLSHLLIKTGEPSDSGNYSCQIHAPTIDSSHSRPAHVQLHVLNGKENPAAIHGSGKTGMQSIANSAFDSRLAGRGKVSSFLLLSPAILSIMMLSLHCLPFFAALPMSYQE